MDAPKLCQNCQTPLAADAPRGLCPACLMKVAMATGTAAGQEKPGFAPPSTQELGLKFPQLEIIELIGRGGMGAVYKARQKELDRIVALKILPPGIGDDAAFAERFAREAKALARLNHPGIVTIHDFGRADGLYFFVMEFVDGVNLRQLLASTRVSPREALAIVPQICDALQFAHDQGIVHRDIKPENILLDRRGRVKVADFGLAKLVESNAPLTPSLSPSDGERVAGKPGEGKTPSLTDAGKVMGTPAYMAPEQVTHPADVDHRADIYALGVVFYQMLTGELPGKPIKAPSSKVQIDVRLDEVVLRALEKRPELRYQQVSEVKTMVETIVNSGSTTAPSTDQVGRRGSRWSWIGSLPKLGDSMVLKRGNRRVFNWPVIGVNLLVVLCLICVVLPIMLKGMSFNESRANLIALVFLGLFAVVHAIRVLPGYISRFESPPTEPGPAPGSLSDKSANRPPGATNPGKWMAAVTVFVLLSLGAGIWWAISDARERQGQTRLRNELTGLIGNSIRQHLAEAGIGCQFISIDVSKDGVAGEAQVTSLKREAGGEPLPSEGRFHFMDRGHGDWTVQGEGALGRIRFSVDGVVLRKSTAASRFALLSAEPYPTRKLTLPWDGSVEEIPDLMAFLPAVRQMPEYKDWLRVRDIRTFFLTTRSDYRFEAHYGGRVHISAGGVEDLVMEVQLFRPDRTLLARMVIGSPEASKWDTNIYDATGSNVVERVRWQKTKDNPQGLIQRVEHEPGTPEERTWLVNRYGVVYKNGAQEFPEYTDAPYLPAAIPAPNVTFGPVIERVVYETTTGRECFLDLETGSFLQPPPEVMALFAATNWEKLYMDEPAATDPMRAWVWASGADLVYGAPAFNHERGIILFDAAMIGTEDYWKMGAAQVTKLLQGKVSGTPSLVGAPPGSADQLQRSHAFRTKDDTMGVLQFVGFTDNPRGVKIRYKLVQTGKQN